MSLARELVGPSYYLTRAIGLWRLRLRDLRSREAPVLVYQMGNVGSSTVARALREQWPGPVAHFHSLGSKDLDAEEQVSKRLFRERRQVPNHILEARHYARRVAGAGSDRRWRVITLVRDPVARNLSAFFQSFNGRLRETDVARRIGRGDPALVGEIADLFIRTFNHRDALTWFDRQLRKNLQVDVFAASFFPERGAQVYDGPLARVLLLRLEDLDRVGPDQICAFLGLPRLELTAVNQAATYYYGDVYAQVRDHIELPDSLLDAMYESTFSRHFYTDAERAAFRARWQSSRAPSATPRSRPA